MLSFLFLSCSCQCFKSFSNVFDAPAQNALTLKSIFVIVKIIRGDGEENLSEGISYFSHHMAKLGRFPSNNHLQLLPLYYFVLVEEANQMVTFQPSRMAKKFGFPPW